MRNKIVDLAVSQVGIKEIPQNEIKYNTWYYGRVVNGSQYAWCAVFISWLANECGIMNTLIPRHSGCGTGVNWFKNKNQWLNAGNRPNKGDIIYFKPTIKGAISSHVGIVIGTTDTSVITVEGNKDNQVKKCQYSLGFSQILGYGTPDYGDTPTPAIGKKYRTYDNVKNKWLPEVEIGDGGYAGNFGNGVSGLMIQGKKYRVHDKVKNKWLGWIDQYNANDSINGYAGNLPNDIDGVQIENATYRVHIKGQGWLSWVNKVDNTSNGYAGIYGKTIDGVQIK